MSSKQHLYGRLPVASVGPSGECLQKKGRHGLLENVHGITAYTGELLTKSLGLQPSGNESAFIGLL